jgi:hypothetical protein
VKPLASRRRASDDCPAACAREIHGELIEFFSEFALRIDDVARRAIAHRTGFDVQAVLRNQQAVLRWRQLLRANNRRQRQRQRQCDQAAAGIANDIGHARLLVKCRCSV